MLFMLKRLAVLLPVLWLLSVLVFGLSKWVDEDPVLRDITISAARSVDNDPAAYDRAYRQAAQRAGLDKPVFYLSFGSAAEPDTLSRIVRYEQRQVQLSLLRRFGNWPALQTYYNGVREIAYTRSDSVGIAALELLLRSDPARIEQKLAASPLPSPVQESWRALADRASPGLLLLPTLRWYGTDNQYHRWLTDVLSGELGISTLDRRPVEEKIWPALRWTALLNGIAIFLAYLISIPTGLYTAWYQGGRADRFFSLGFLLLFSLPAFWAATMLSSFLTTPAYGFDLFPTIGVGEVADGAGWWTYLTTRLHHLFLPVLCLTYPSLAFLTRQMREAARAEIGKDYVKTARMKGLGVHRVIWGHVFRNASFPIITLLASLLPALLAGSVLIEIIFNLPGMGRLLVDAARNSDWPVVMAITLLNGTLTVVGILLADLGYRLADPRVGKPTSAVANANPL
ncbi:hypothetical protein CEQ90_04860 [Lewinellaceae bacterium SD302]|nr:hypothetical protein CEQ90_04860 [Lewinellaceae bacterium SD302]